jgi:hypothetical protein
VVNQDTTKGVVIAFVTSVFTRKFFKLLTAFLILVILETTIIFAQEEADENKIAGELFGVPVSIGNYYFAKRVVLSLDAKWRSVPKTDEELEDLVWQELLFSYEAFRRGIEVSDEEVEEQIDKILKAEKVEFNWREDKQAYEDWVKERLKASVELFENQIAHLVKLEKLRQQVLDSIEPEVTEEEAYQKFLDEYNSLGVEIIQFEDSELEEAEKLFEQIKSDSELWEKKKEEKKDSYRNLKGPYALDFLINLWGFKREDVYAMIDMKKDEFYKPSPIYKGYAVFKIGAIRKADPEEFDKHRDYYFDKIRNIKKYQGFKDWAKELKKQANIKRGDVP